MMKRGPTPSPGGGSNQCREGNLPERGSRHRSLDLKKFSKIKNETSGCQLDRHCDLPYKPAENKLETIVLLHYCSEGLLGAHRSTGGFRLKRSLLPPLGSPSEFNQAHPHRGTYQIHTVVNLQFLTKPVAVAYHRSECYSQVYCNLSAGFPRGY